MKKWIMLISAFIIIIMSNTTLVFADHCTDCAAQNGGKCGLCGYSCGWENGVCVDNDERGTEEKSEETPYYGDDWWGQANNFWNGQQSDTAKDAVKTLTPIINLIKTVGNMVFVAVTVVLGVKYIWGGVESKASVKDSLMTLIVAASVFYGWNTLSALFMTGNRLSFVGGTAEGTSLNVYSTILYVCNFLAVGGLIYIGARYMMAGAEGKSQLKAKGVPIVLGIIMVYATITFLNLIVGLI